MLYIRLENFVPVEVSTEHPKKDAPKVWAKQPVGGKYDGAKTQYENTGNGWITRNDIGSIQYANTLATLLTEKLGRTFLGTDAGSHCSPRYDVIEAPKVGDAVSYSFNGDSYPCGHITKITPKWHITTSTGHKFRRVGNSAGFRREGGTWWMIGGHVEERNPHI